MRHERVTDEIREQAALHALGMLEPQEAGAFEQHLEACSVCEAEVRAFQGTAAALPLGLPAAAPDPAVRRKLLEQAAPARDLRDHVVRAAQGDWILTEFPGVQVKPLFANRAKDQVTTLVRMAPGSSYPSHHHEGPEECYVLEGELRIGDLVLRVGDYGCAPTGTIHPPTTSPLGCLLLIVSTGHDPVVISH